MPTRIVVGGPSSCGKSTLTASLFRCLEEGNHDVGIHEIDVYSDTLPCILGHKPWNRRRKKKHAWFNPTIARRIGEFASDVRDIVFGDLPGKVTNQFLPLMVKPADAAVIVARDWGGFVPWEEFFFRRRIPVILKVVSYHGQLPLLPVPSDDYTLVGGLNRAVLRSPEVQFVADHLIVHARQRARLAG